MTDHPTRRKVLATLATAAAVSAASTVALAASPALAGADAALPSLWAEYLGHAHAHEAAQAAYGPVRAAFDAEMPPFPPDVLPGHHWEAMQPLWRSYGLEELSDASNDAYNRASATIAAIQATPAEGLIGVGIKLAALPVDSENVSDEDLKDAIESAMRDIARLTGTDFAADATEVFCGEAVS
jgi:hypothetical protein